MINNRNSTSGIVLPAEWSEHRATLMCWPANRDLWGSHYNEVLVDYENLVRAIAAFEPIKLIAAPKDFQYVRKCLQDIRTRVEVVSIEIDDGWVRDNGPTYIRRGDGSQCIVWWQFNAWGGKYKKFENDARLPLVLSKLDKIEILEAPLILEGGALNSDGAGTLLTTESVVLNQNRNPGLTKTEAENLFRKFLGVRKTIWLPAGLHGDETDGHIDNIAMFVAVGRVAALNCREIGDLNYEILRENISILESETDASGQALTIHRIDQPDAIYSDGRRLMASYLNFYFVNGGLLLPVFGKAQDVAALKTFETILPNRQIVPIQANRLIIGGGGIHCMTQQWPV